MGRGERRLEKNLTRTLVEKISDQQLHAEGLEVVEVVHAYVCMHVWSTAASNTCSALYKAQGARGIHAIGVRAKP